MWDCGKNCTGFSIGFFHNYTFFSSFYSLIFNQRTFGGFDAFYPLFRVVVEVGKKSFSCGWLSSGWMDKVGSAILCMQRKKAFYIIPNYRYQWILHAVEPAERRATFCSGHNYNFDYVTCCGAKFAF